MVSRMHRPCYTCRRRRIECDLTQPACNKCKKAGLECFEKRPLRWVEGAVFRGKMKKASKTAVSVSSTQSIPPPNKPALTTGNPEGLTGVSDSEVALDYFTRVPSPLDDPSTINLDRTSRYYLYYYSKCVCKLFIMYDSKKNPLRNLIPAALDHPVLLASIVALSAQHMANTTQSFQQSEESTTYSGRGSRVDARHDALLFKCKAIQGLAGALNDANFLYQKDILVASAFLLIFLDLLESGSDKWNFHLEGVKKLIAQIQCPEVQTSPRDLGTTVHGLRDFIIRQIYLIDTLGATYTRPRLLSNSTSIRQLTTPLEMSIDRAYLGCPDYILDVLQTFSTSRDILTSPERDTKLEETNPLIQELTSVLDSTRTFNCHTWAASLLPTPPPHPSSSSTPSITMLATLAQSYKLGSLIYGTRILDALTGVTTPTPLNDLVSELIRIIDTLRTGDNALFRCILWPLFVAGLESRDQAQRDAVMDCLERFWFETKCLNVVNAGNILRRFWRRGDEGAGGGEVGESRWVLSIGLVGGDWLLI